MSYTSSKAAQRAYGEIDDFLDTIRMKIDRIERNFDRLFALGRGTRAKQERDQIMRSIENDLEKVNKDIKVAEKSDIKRMHEEKRNEYEEKLLKLKVKVNKQKAKFEKIFNGGEQELVNLAAE